MPSRVIWCLGMYASASTWMFNAVREIQAAAGTSGVSVQFVRSTVDLDQLDRRGPVHIVKSHEITSEAVLMALAARSDTILVTIREPRDAVASVMEYHHQGFAKALTLVKESSALCLDFMKDRRARCFSYETQFFDDRRTLHNLARIMGCAISDEAAHQCFDRLSRPAVENLIAQFPHRKGILQDPISGDYLDPKTQWHTCHAGRSGEIGRWRHKLSPAQAREVEALVECQRMHRLAVA